MMPIINPRTAITNEMAVAAITELSVNVNVNINENVYYISLDYIKL